MTGEARHESPCLGHMQLYFLQHVAYASLYWICSHVHASDFARKLAQQNLICVCCWLAIYLTTANLLLESLYWLWDLCIDVVPDVTFKCW